MTITIQPHVGAVLDSLPNNMERARWCLKKAEEARNDYFNGQLAEIEYVLNSDSYQFSYLTAEARRTIGRIRWNKSAIAQQLASDEQMFSRWANMYKNLA